ncbi:amino acid (glutamine) ABC transporter, periplasmic amino acid binding protein [Legionella lansingensis]|uniref:Amino acid (Glutamine) ABC transporter periplasmic amino acid binding protein n=1 Tax=Legionella lansingensis TaxID=45067 RepID=A0A0W0VUJ4_9GAMM|nr:cation:dicarboxylase symporter family transporter [Legionella lansingensis]KTD23577.1 amino acid (glutamine) ABC transporter periplasmic amino acid binding protein [Legionella lansingensis]SNV52320.1 amino acid (glutamine) ABC transporter, periplasmic amino acid binding protein [Legionella lansingensis]
MQSPIPKEKPLLFVSPSLPVQVIISSILGILVGLFFGDKAAPLGFIGTIYTMLLESVVFPYIICTLLSSLGDLSPHISLKLLKKSWWIYLLLIFITLGILIILGLSIPLNIPLTSPQQTDYATKSSILELLIPYNLFYALANNYVPAIVIFCIFFGITLQFIANKTIFFNILEIINKTCLSFWNWLVRFAPLAAFSLLAKISGTIRIDQLTALSEFLILFSIGIVLLTFWLIPVIISSCTDIHYKSLFFELRNALIISVSTTLSVVALPYVRQATVKFITQKQQITPSRETVDIIQTTLLIGYPIAQVGNFFVYLFMLFALLFFNQNITNFKHILLPLISYLSSIGSPTTSIDAVLFLSDWLNLPNDTNNLYLGIMPLIRYGQILASVMGFSFVTILVTFAFTGNLTINYKRIVTHLLIACFLLVLLVQFLKYFFPNPATKNYNRLNSFSIDQALTNGVKATVMPPFDESKIAPVNTDEDTLFRIQRSGVLRVGFNADMRPFVFYNDKHQLVGYDIAYAYSLAQALHVSLEFVPFTWEYLINDLEGNMFDIAMSAIYVTEQRLQNVMFTESYFRSPISLVVPKQYQDNYKDANQIRNINNLKIGVFNDPVLIPLIRQNFPNANIIILQNASGNAPAVAFEQQRINAMLWSEAQTRVWVLAHPEYVSVVPFGVPAPFLMAYMIRSNSPQFLRFLNYWLELKKNDGFQKNMYSQWILIRPIKDEQPRWSIWKALVN